MSTSLKRELIKECKRQFDNCLYTSTSFLIWLRRLRFIKGAFIIGSVVFGAVAGWNIVAHSDVLWVRYGAAACALLAGVLPAIHASLKLDQSLEQFAVASGELKNLSDRFRFLGYIRSKGPYEDFEREFKEQMVALEEVRKRSLTTPEWCFTEAQAKIAKGDYQFDVDDAERGEARGQ